MFSRMASLAAIAIGMIASAVPPPPTPHIELLRPRARINPRNGRTNNPRGTVANRGLKRIQGRQAAK